MATQNPVFYDSTQNVHRPMDADATVPPTAVPISASGGNIIQRFSDGLYVGNQNGLAVYVDSVAGNDSNQGTSSGSPFKTIDRAFQFLMGAFPYNRYAGSGVTLALKANQAYPVSGDFNLNTNSDLTITFYGDPKYGNWNSGTQGPGCNPWNISDLQRPVIQPQVSQVNGQWKIGGINRSGGNLYLQGVTVQLPAAPTNPAMALYGGYVDFIRNTSVGDQGFVSIAGVIVNMTDINAYFGLMGSHARSFTKFYEFCSQFQINGKLMNAANAPTAAQQAARQYFIKFFNDYAGNNQSILNLQTTTANSSTGSGFIMCSWSDALAQTVVGSATNLATFPLSFDPGYGLINYIFNLNKTANGQTLNFLNSRLY
jgi:hypothetical protein